MKECGTKEEITLFKWVPIGPIPSETNLTNPYAPQRLARLSTHLLSLSLPPWNTPLLYSHPQGKQGLDFKGCPVFISI